MSQPGYIPEAKAYRPDEYIHDYSSAPPAPPPPSLNDGSSVNEGAIRNYLSRNCWPIGLQTVLINGISNCPVRFFICDDSGSMMSNDGHRLIGEGNITKLIPCSRWREMGESLKFHIGIAQAANAPTEFRLLNGADSICIGQSDANDFNNVPALTSILDGSPGGATPLCFHVKKIMQQIELIAPQLRAAGKKAALVILTDGEASDGDIVAAMRPLHQLPVWVVIRLCTDNDQIVDYWNNIDGQIELNMDVIDDPLGEAKEIYAFNKWFTYGEPLHRLREFGVTVKELDLIDEAPLSLEQMKNFCCFLFGIKQNELPLPELDWNQFVTAVSKHNDKLPMIWNPINGRLCKWIDTRKLTQTYGRGRRAAGKNEICSSCTIM